MHEHFSRLEECLSIPRLIVRLLTHTYCDILMLWALISTDSRACQLHDWFCHGRHVELKRAYLGYIFGQARTHSTWRGWNWVPATEWWPVHEDISRTLPLWWTQLPRAPGILLVACSICGFDLLFRHITCLRDHSIILSLIDTETIPLGLFYIYSFSKHIWS